MNEGENNLISFDLITPNNQSLEIFVLKKNESPKYGLTKGANIGLIMWIDRNV